MARVWFLRMADHTLATLSLLSVQQSWFVCDFASTETFEEVRPLFDRELDYLDQDKIEAWEDAYKSIGRLVLRLEPVEGGDPIENFLLHVRGNEAWFRY